VRAGLSPAAEPTAIGNALESQNPYWLVSYSRQRRKVSETPRVVSNVYHFDTGLDATYWESRESGSTSDPVTWVRLGSGKLSKMQMPITTLEFRLRVVVHS